MSRINSLTPQKLSIEGLESRNLMAVNVLPLDAPTVESPTDARAEYFVADSFGFGVEREMKESGEKGGTADINIGVGELQECTVSKSMDTASAKLAQFAINGNSPGTAEIDFVEVAGADEGQPVCYLKYKLDRCFIKSWSTSGDADDRPTEEVAFYYNKIAFAYRPTVDGTEWSDAMVTELAESLNGRSASKVADVDEVFSADNSSFGVEREMKESGEKGGTEDINIGIGELQE